MAKKAENRAKSRDMKTSEKRRRREIETATGEEREKVKERRTIVRT